MHPYEMASVLRTRGKDSSIKINYGSLYTVVDSLQRRKLIEPHETQREGRRPERTVYRLTNQGRVSLVDWLSDMISQPVKEFTQFEAALSFLAVLPPEEVAELLQERVGLLDLEIHQLRAVLGMTIERKLPRLFTVETEYWLMLREAELAWVRELADEIAEGRLDSMNMWREIQREIDERHEAEGAGEMS
ncbi:MAG: helix-turn-helix transcriptional regulator [Thermomicrobiales bacterium]|nr:helix-turn-helix transcriptional regulator [Thermomicrobiales bacterium]